MRKIAIVTVVLAMFASRPAEACRGNAPCPWIVHAGALALGGAMVGGYAYGTGYFIYHDLKDESQTMKYGGGELAYNGTFAALMYAIAIDAAQDGDKSTALVAGAWGTGHAILAMHGAYRIKEEWRDPGHAPDNTKEWIAGIAYGANTLVWTAMLPNDHDRTYGIVEASVNGPIAVGLGYLAVDSFRDGDRGYALLFGAGAALSGAFAYHGLKTAIDPPTSPGLDLLGTDLMPTAVSDGREVAPGLSVSGSW